MVSRYSMDGAHGSQPPLRGVPHRRRGAPENTHHSAKRGLLPYAFSLAASIFRFGWTVFFKSVRLYFAWRKLQPLLLKRASWLEAL